MLPIKLPVLRETIRATGTDRGVPAKGKRANEGDPGSGNRSILTVKTSTFEFGRRPSRTRPLAILSQMWLPRAWCQKQRPDSFGICEYLLGAKSIPDISFFTGCHYFVPLWDKAYDTYETYIERTPFSTNGLLAVAAKIRAGNGRLDQVFHYCLEEAQGIARSTLFGPIVRKEAAMAMLILSVWSQNGWLPCG